MRKSSYYRARLATFYDFISKSPEQEVKYWRNGVVLPDYLKQFETLVDEKENDEEKIQNLSLTELMTFNNWFVIHPEKVSGKEEITSSIAFPVTIKGTKEDVINTIQIGLDKTNKDKRLRIIRIKLQAELEILKLLKI